MLSSLTKKAPKKTFKPYDPTVSGSGLGCTWCKTHTGAYDQKKCRAVEGAGDEKLCTYDISYEDGSGYSAALYTDSFDFGGGAATTSTAVGAYFEDNMADGASVTGIVGFAGAGESESGAPTPFDDLVSSGSCDDVFALCMPSRAARFLEAWLWWGELN